MKRLGILAALGAFLFGPAAYGATLVGDEVTSSFIGIERTGVVGDGYDLFYGTGLGLDFNAGPDELEFRFDVLVAGNFTSIAGPGTRTFILSGLDFAGGASLIGFELLSSVFADISIETTATSVIFRFTDQGDIQAPTTLISGRFLTNASAVPVPPAAAMMVLGLIGAAGIARRRA